MTTNSSNKVPANCPRWLNSLPFVTGLAMAILLTQFALPAIGFAGTVPSNQENQESAEKPPAGSETTSAETAQSLPDSDEDTPQASASLAKLRMDYKASLDSFRSHIKDAQIAINGFYVEDRAQSTDWREKYQLATSNAERELAKLKQYATKLFLLEPKPEPELIGVMERVQTELFKSDDYDTTYEVCDKLLTFNPKNDDARLNWGLAAILREDLDAATDFKENYGSFIGKASDREWQLYQGLDDFKELRAREMKMRDEDARGEKLPTAKIRTTKGTIVIELLENQAPDTVANFISVAESGFYDNTIFHRVLGKFMAQTGGYAEGGSRKQIGYQIYCECDREDRRDHFRGSVSMAKQTQPNTGTTEFFINFVPTPALNGNHTVFGRVTSGFDVLHRLTRTGTYNEDGQETPIEGATPDKIISVKIFDKRDHEYKPNKVTE